MQKQKSSDKAANQKDAGSAEKKSGKYHYNPGNMAGEKAGIVEEIERQEAAEDGDCDEHGRPRSSPENQKSDSKP